MQRFGLTTDDKTATSSRLRQSPPQSQQMCCFHARRPTCYGNLKLSAINLKGIIVFYYILPRAEGDRYAQASKHVPRVGRGRCAAFFFSPACCLPANMMWWREKNKKKTVVKTNQAWTKKAVGKTKQTHVGRSRVARVKMVTWYKWVSLPENLRLRKQSSNAGG